MAFQAGSIFVTIDLDRSPLTKSIQAVKAQLKTLGNQVGEALVPKKQPKIVDDKAVGQQVSKVKERFRGLTSAVSSTFSRLRTTVGNVLNNLPIPKKLINESAIGRNLQAVTGKVQGFARAIKTTFSGLEGSLALPVSGLLAPIRGVTTTAIATAKAIRAAFAFSVKDPVRRIKLIVGGFKEAIVWAKRFGAVARLAFRRATFAARQFWAVMVLTTKLSPNTLLIKSFALLQNWLTKSIFTLKNLIFVLGAVAFVRRAKDVETLGIAFNSLNRGIGVVSSTMLTKLRAATKNTVSDLELMRTTNNAILLGVARSADEFALLANAARRLGRAVGRDTVDALNDLAVGIGRQSRLILDNLGLIVKVGKANEVYAGKLGKTVSELTDAENRQAFFNATMDAVRRKLKDLGPDIETTADQWDRLGAVLNNTFSILSANIVGGRLPKAIADFIQTSQRQIVTVITIATSLLERLLNRVVKTIHRFFKGELNLAKLISGVLLASWKFAGRVWESLIKAFGPVFVRTLESIFFAIWQLLGDWLGRIFLRVELWALNLIDSVIKTVVSGLSPIAGTEVGKAFLQGLEEITGIQVQDLALQRLRSGVDDYREALQLARKEGQLTEEQFRNLWTELTRFSARLKTAISTGLRPSEDLLEEYIELSAKLGRVLRATDVEQAQKRWRETIIQTRGLLQDELPNLGDAFEEFDRSMEAATVGTRLEQAFENLADVAREGLPEVSKGLRETLPVVTDEAAQSVTGIAKSLQSTAVKQAGDKLVSDLTETVKDVPPIFRDLFPEVADVVRKGQEDVIEAVETRDVEASLESSRRRLEILFEKFPPLAGKLGLLRGNIEIQTRDLQETRGFSEYAERLKKILDLTTNILKKAPEDVVPVLKEYRTSVQTELDEVSKVFRGDKVRDALASLQEKLQVRFEGVPPALFALRNFRAQFEQELDSLSRVRTFDEALDRLRGFLKGVDSAIVRSTPEVAGQLGILRQVIEERVQALEGIKFPSLRVALGEVIEGLRETISRFPTEVPELTQLRESFEERFENLRRIRGVPEFLDFLRSFISDVEKLLATAPPQAQFELRTLRRVLVSELNSLEATQPPDLEPVVAGIADTLRKLTDVDIPRDLPLKQTVEGIADALSTSISRIPTDAPELVELRNALLRGMQSLADVTDFPGLLRGLETLLSQIDETIAQATPLGRRRLEELRRVIFTGIEGVSDSIDRIRDLPDVTDFLDQFTAELRASLTDLPAEVPQLVKLRQFVSSELERFKDVLSPEEFRALLIALQELFTDFTQQFREIIDLIPEDVPHLRQLRRDFERELNAMQGLRSFDDVNERLQDFRERVEKGLATAPPRVRIVLERLLDVIETRLESISELDPAAVDPITILTPDVREIFEPLRASIKAEIEESGELLGGLGEEFGFKIRTLGLDPADVDRMWQRIRHQLDLRFDLFPNVAVAEQVRDVLNEYMGDLERAVAEFDPTVFTERVEEAQDKLAVGLQALSKTPLAGDRKPFEDLVANIEDGKNSLIASLSVDDATKAISGFVNRLRTEITNLNNLPKTELPDLTSGAEQAIDRFEKAFKDEEVTGDLAELAKRYKDRWDQVLDITDQARKNLLQRILKLASAAKNATDKEALGKHVRDLRFELDEGVQQLSQGLERRGDRLISSIQAQVKAIRERAEALGDQPGVQKFLELLELLEEEAISRIKTGTSHIVQEFGGTRKALLQTIKGAAETARVAIRPLEADFIGEIEKIIEGLKTFMDDKIPIEELNLGRFIFFRTKDPLVDFQPLLTSRVVQPLGDAVNFLEKFSRVVALRRPDLFTEEQVLRSRLFVKLLGQAVVAANDFGVALGALAPRFLDEDEFRKVLAPFKQLKAKLEVEVETIGLKEGEAAIKRLDLALKKFSLSPAMKVEVAELKKLLEDVFGVKVKRTAEKAISDLGKSLEEMRNISKTFSLEQVLEELKKLGVEARKAGRERPAELIEQILDLGVEGLTRQLDDLNQQIATLGFGEAEARVYALELLFQRIREELGRDTEALRKFDEALAQLKGAERAKVTLNELSEQFKNLASAAEGIRTERLVEKFQQLEAELAAAGKGPAEFEQSLEGLARDGIAAVRDEADKLQTEIDDFNLEPGERQIAGLTRVLEVLKERLGAGNELVQQFEEEINKLKDRQIILEFKTNLQEEARKNAEFVGDVIGDGIFGGIMDAYERGESVSKSWSKIASDIFRKSMDQAITGLGAKITEELGKLFEGAGIGAGVGGLAVGLIGMASAILSNLASKRESTVEDFNEAVNSAEAVRGVVAGPTNVAISKVGESLKQAMRGTELLLERIIEVLETGGRGGGGGAPNAIFPLSGSTTT